MKQLENIKKKLYNLKSIDKKLEIFGSEQHQYKFNPVLSESKILAYEKKNNLILPKDYRYFLKEIGNGGAGPFYGLLSLEDNEDQIINLDLEFSFTQKKPCFLGNYNDYDEKIENAKTEDEEQNLWDKKNFLIDQEYQNATKGITFLCHEGCAMFNILIIKGKESGNVWWFNFSDEVGVVPILHEGRQISFFDWYEIWLDKSLEYFKNRKKLFSTYGQFVDLKNIK